MQSDEEVPEFPVTIPEDSDSSEHHERKEYSTLANGILSPRHRKLAEMFASGASNAKVAEDLNYTPGRVSVLKNNALIAQEIERIRERIYEDSIATRMKAMADPALSVIEQALLNRENRFKKSEQLSAAQWTIEKLDGKAIQKLDVGGSMLGSILDKLDGLKASGRTVDQLPDLEITALNPGETEAAKPETPPISDALKDWIENF
jgi:hypothetical protein